MANFKSFVQIGLKFRKINTCITVHKLCNTNHQVFDGRRAFFWDDQLSFRYNKLKRKETILFLVRRGKGVTKKEFRRPTKKKKTYIFYFEILFNFKSMFRPIIIKLLFILNLCIYKLKPFVPSPRGKGWMVFPYRLE